MPVNRPRFLSVSLLLVALMILPGAEAVVSARLMAEGEVNHQRLLPLEGGRNFRDLGGYRTADGRHVKWGVLFRSGAMNGLTAGDYATLSKIGIRTVCDFRDVNERKAEPTNWPEGQRPAMFADDYHAMDAGLVPPGDMRKWTPEQAKQAMASSYPKMLTTFAPQYRRMFAELVAGHAPLAFHCSAGKDRTGVAAALILTALGVPRATVVEDYLLTNRYLTAQAVLAKQGRAPTSQPWAQLPPAVLGAFMAADRSYIEAALTKLDTHMGGSAGYFRDEMKLSAADIKRLRTLYLE